MTALLVAILVVLVLILLSMGGGRRYPYQALSGDDVIPPGEGNDSD